MEIADIMIQLERIRQLNTGKDELIIRFENGFTSSDLDKAVTEALDILYDYALMAEKQKMLIDKYETPEPPIKKSDAVYLCPDCGRRVYVHHSHCHHCGKAMEWGDITFKGRRMKKDGDSRS